MCYIVLMNFFFSIESRGYNSVEFIIGKRIGVWPRVNMENNMKKNCAKMCW